ncbi:MAG: O-antigen ligase family protein [Patescibacteria group bacterium]|nr:O-antigen ligase family protein [Patescibacteria group bacterium]
MKAAALKYTFLSSAARLSAIIIALIPFHALLTVWISSGFGHYTAFRLWKELLLLFVGLAVVYLVVTDHKIRSHTLTRRLVWLILAYAGLQLLTGFLSLRAGTVTPKALAYGLLVDLRFLTFFLFTWAIALRTNRLKANWQKLLLWPALVVIVFGLLQIFVLPADFLRHFGYGPHTIQPFETVNSNHDYVRIASTLRGPNPLGAYLIIPITALLVLCLQAAKKWRLALGVVAGFVVLGFSFSRSALLGALISASLVKLLLAKPAQAKRLLMGFAVVVVVVGSLGALVVHKNSRLENVVLHTQTKSAVATTSNDGHLHSLQRGLHDIAHQPLGRGPGSAGPASVYNNGRARIAENYFLQLGQEVGMLGLGLFLLINAGLGYLLWLRRTEPLALILFASLIGLTVVNLLSHAWADDTLAYVWWGLAGIAMVTVTADEKSVA